MPKLPIKKIIGDRQERCLYCSGTKIIKKGKRRKKFETVQLWYCKDCDTIFAPVDPARSASANLTKCLMQVTGLCFPVDLSFVLR